MILRGLEAGAKVPGDIVQIAVDGRIRTATVTATGGVKGLTLAYFNYRSKKYEEHKFDEFMEVTSFVGNITLKEGKPFLHVHGTFSRKDLSVLGGHIISATVFPILEVSITPGKDVVRRRFDERLGLNVIDNSSPK